MKVYLAIYYPVAPRDPTVEGIFSSLEEVVAYALKNAPYATMRAAFPKRLRVTEWTVDLYSIDEPKRIPYEALNTLFLKTKEERTVVDNSRRDALRMGELSEQERATG